MLIVTESVRDCNAADAQCEVENATVPVMLVFYASWSGPSKQLAPTIGAIGDAYAGRACVGTVDIDAQRVMAEKYCVKAVPAVLFYKGGQLAGRMTSNLTRTAIEAELQKHL